MINVARPFYLVAALLLWVSASAAAPLAPGDYDGDGLSDFVMAGVNRAKKTTTFYIRMGAGTELVQSLASSGDAIAPGAYSGESFLNHGVVFVRNIHAPLEWTVRNPDGSSSIFKYGMPDDTPVAADYDCDGKTDLAVVREGRGVLAWHIQRSSSDLSVSIEYGEKGDRVFGADADGDGCAELFLVRMVKDEMNWYYRKLRNDNVQNVAWGASGDLPLRPIDLNGDGKPDFVVVRRAGPKQAAYVRYGANSSGRVKLGTPDTVPLTGNFTGTNGFGYLDREKKRFVVLGADGKKNSYAVKGAAKILVRPDGSVVQPDQNERLYGSTCTAKPGSDGAKQGFIWKPVSVGMNAGKPAILFPLNVQCSNTSRVEVLGKDGEVLTGTGIRYCDGPLGGPVYDVPMSASSLRPYAPITVRNTFSDGACEARVINDPAARVD